MRITPVRVVTPAVAAIAACAWLGAGITTASTANQRLSIYAVATRAQYVDYSDGITRAKYQNPFGVDTKSFSPTTKGPTSSLPGNSVFYTFKLYGDSTLNNSIGTATYNCTFNFNSRAICQAEFDTDKGILFASGPVDFGSTTSLMAVTGGTGSYLGLGGQVATVGPGAKATGKAASRLQFELVR